MKKMVFLKIDIMFFLFLFSFPVHSQLTWNYARLNGSVKLPDFENNPAMLLTQLTPSNYPNIAVYPDNNADQSEMTINASNSGFILAGANVTVQNVNPINHNQGFYSSTNEGNVWTGSDNLPTNYITTSDPAVAYDYNGFAYYSFLKSSDTGISWKAVVKKTYNNGGSWTSDVEIPNTYSPDKDNMVIDANAGSPYRNYIYVAWTARGFNNPTPIKLSRSTDGGTTFLEPITISGSTGYFKAWGVCLAVGPNGELYATWVYYNGLNDPGTGLGFNKSTDGGATWGIPTTIISNPGFSGIRPYLKSQPYQIRAASWPSIDVDKSSGSNRGKIYVVWANATNTIDHTIPYIDLISSTNGGSIWSSKIQVNNDISSTDKWEPWVNVDVYGGVNVVFYDSRIDPTNNIQTQTYMARSTDGGVTFSNYQISDVAFTPAPIPNTDAGYMGDYIGITSTREFVIPSWNDNRTGKQQAYIARFDILQDLATLNKSVNYSATAQNNGRHLVEDGSGNYHLVFASGGEVFYRKSISGTSWQIPIHLSDGNGNNNYPNIAISGSYVYATWQKSLGGNNYNIYFASSADGGVSWNNYVLSAVSLSSDPLPDIQAYSNYTMVVFKFGSGIKSFWSYYPNPSPGYWVTNTTGFTTAYFPTLTTAISGATTYFSLAFSNSSDNQIYYYYYDPSIQNWTGGPNNLSAIVPGTNPVHLKPSITFVPGTSQLHVAWQRITNGGASPYDYIIIHRKSTNYNSWPNEYSTTYYQAQGVPSISALTSNKVDLLFQTASIAGYDNQIYKMRYTGTNWGAPVYISSNSVYPSVSSGNTTSKYVWTNVTSSPYTVMLSSETLNKGNPINPLDYYSRSIAWLDSTGSYIEVRLHPLYLLMNDGTKQRIDIMPASLDTMNITPDNSLDLLSSSQFQLPSNANQILFDYSISCKDINNIVNGLTNNISLDFNLTSKNNQVVLSNTQTNKVNTGQLPEIRKQFSINLNGLNNLQNIKASVKLTGLIPLSGTFASLGHIFDYTSLSSLSKQGFDNLITPTEVNGFCIQNFPNPFNPTTVISYQLPKDGVATIKIFDILGREIKTLVDEYKSQGRYTVSFDASKIASGVYFYQLREGNFISTKKMILSK